jgi:5'-3' exonuclease
MGIKGLSTFINSINGKVNGIDVVHLSMFSGKKIAFDFTNQLYRFLYRSNNDKSYLLEFINLIHKFQKYKIDLIFVFDGKPIDEKQYVIEHRKAYREKLIKKIDEMTENSDSSDEYADTIKHLSKKTNTVKCSYILECKKLFDVLGIAYIHIDDVEADAIFRYLLETNIADACFSGDMDVVAYGCHTILKDLDYRKDTVQIIKYDLLLETLGISSEQFLYTCILSGTDYNNSLKHSKFEINLELVKKYKTIEGITCNIDEINNELPDEYKKSFPKRFDWETTFSVFTEDITSDTQLEIYALLIIFQRNKLQKTKKTLGKLQEYINNIMCFDKDCKYVRKIIEFLKLKYDIVIR